MTEAVHRWQPTRCGLLNLFRYDDEVFRFAGGRLLLRGNNGSGKTRVLALTLPFLFDGELRPARVEPDGDRNRRFEWHLLMDRFHERTGYTWLEFMRRNADGSEQVCTIGCGLRAVQGHQGLRQRWFFVTPQRVGPDFPLKRADGTPWNRDDCKQGLGQAGRLYDRLEDYRRAVDEALFGLGEQRYRSLIDLLIELRRPQLSRTLDEERLTRALSDALPPLDSSVVNDVAEGFQGLEEERRRLADTRAALEAIEAFHGVYQEYLAVHLRRLADQVRRQHRRYDEAQGALRDAQERIAAAQDRLQAIEHEREQLERERVQAVGEERALRSGEVMKSAEQLARLREDCRRQEAQVASDADELLCAEAEARRQQARLQELESALSQIQEQQAAAARLLLEQARALGCARELEAALPEADESTAAELRRSLERLQRAVVQLQQLAAERADAQRRDELRAEQELAAEQARDTALADNEAADDAWQQTCNAHQQAWVAFRGHWDALPMPVDDHAELLRQWFDDPAAPEPLRALLSAVIDSRRRDLVVEDGRLQLRETELQRQQDSLEHEAEALRQGKDPTPSLPFWRDPDARVQADGAPLWACCDFIDALDQAERDGIEAALAASQLLDAWIDAEGRLLHPVSGDSIVLAAPRRERHLGLALRPDPDAALPAERIAAVLAGIAVDEPEAAAWVAADGNWGLGPLRGRAPVTPAQHIGAASRAAARARRLQTIADLLRQLDSEAEQLAQERTQLAARQQELDAAWQAAPDAEPVWQSRRALQAAQAALSREQEALARVQEQRRASRAALQAAQEALRQSATDCSLAAWLEQLPQLQAAVQAYGNDMAIWLHHCQRLHEQRQRRDELQEESREVQERLHRRRMEWEASDSRRAELERELAVLEASTGAAVAEVLEQLDALSARQRQLQTRTSQVQAERDEARDERARATEAQDNAQQRLALFTEDRAKAIAGLRAVVDRGLLAGLGAAWREALAPDAADTQVVQLARRLAKELSALQAEEQELSRVGTRIGLANQELQTALSQHDYRVVIEEHHGIWEVRIPVDGKDHSITDMGLRLNAEVEHLRQALTAHEREVIENFLIDEACEQLHDLLQGAEAWIADVNRELSDRPMSTGLTLRFRRLIADDAPAGCEEACKRLLRLQHTWSPEDRAALAAFLQQGITSAREALPGHSWQEQLALALDYRRWHRIAIERQQNGRWSRLTRRSHGTGSGGEKAIALTVPQFAAAHYRACPEAPRLIMLDEAFVGIDSDMRRKCMGLLTAFDLDVVMTSEREWGCYDTVPALAIYQLSAHPGTDCIATTRYVWNGRERRQDDDER